MSSSARSTARGERPEQIKPGFRLFGPALVVAATGVGAADLVSTLVAGQKFGYALLWAVVLGCILKIVLVEGAGRYSLATGNTIYHGWAQLGLWTSIYFGPYIIIWGFVYGAAAMAGTGIPLAALFGGDVAWWGIASGIIGLVLVWLGRYSVVEKISTVLVGMMFVIMLGAAILTLPNIADILRGLIPTVPQGSFVNMLAVAGGVGGTITLAAYGYWLREKQWNTPRHMSLMRSDNTVAYVVTGIFVVSTLIVGAELLYSYGLVVNAKDSDKAMLDLAEILGQRYGTWASWMFLVGFWAAAMSSLIGVWNGVSMMFADFVGDSRARLHKRAIVKAEENGQAAAGFFARPLRPDRYVSGGFWYKAYILWLTFPPMVMLFVGRPTTLILAYGVLGSLFMPFLAITLLLILNSRTNMPGEWRNGPLSNFFLGLCTLFFLALAVNELASRLAGLF